jgi:hypothetical protein
MQCGRPLQGHLHLANREAWIPESGPERGFAGEMTVLKCAGERPSPYRRGSLALLAATLGLISWFVSPALPAAEPARSMPAATDPVTAAELLEEIRQLRREVGETKQLREEVEKLRAAQSPPAPAVEISPAKAPSAPPAAAALPPVPTMQKTASAPPKSPPVASSGIPTRYHSGAFGPPKPG